MKNEPDDKFKEEVTHLVVAASVLATMAVKAKSEGRLVESTRLLTLSTDLTKEAISIIKSLEEK